jgi:hypothetical protein
VKKELAAKVVNTNITEFLGLLNTFEDNEELVEATTQFIDYCFEFGKLTLYTSSPHLLYLYSPFVVSSQPNLTSWHKGN